MLQLKSLAAFPASMLAVRGYTKVVQCTAVLQGAIVEHCFDYSVHSTCLDIEMDAAADDDDDDLFAEFDVDMDMDNEPAPPAKPSMSIPEEADDMHMDIDRDTTTPAADAIPEDASLFINTKTDEQALSSVSHDAALLDMPDKLPQSGKNSLSHLQLQSR